MTTSSRSLAGLILWIKWMFAFAVAGVLSFLLFNGILLLFQNILGMPVLLALVIIALVIGAVLGAVQAAILLSTIQRAELWIVLTAIGFAAGTLVPIWLHIDPLLGHIAMGLLIGAGQWSILRRFVSQSSWWIVANIIGWSTDFTGAVTGLVLVWLLRHPIQQPDQSPSSVSSVVGKIQGE